MTLGSPQSGEHLVPGREYLISAGSPRTGEFKRSAVFRGPGRDFYDFDRDVWQWGWDRDYPVRLSRTPYWVFFEVLE